MLPPGFTAGKKEGSPAIRSRIRIDQLRMDDQVKVEIEDIRDKVKKSEAETVSSESGKDIKKEVTPSSHLLPVPRVPGSSPDSGLPDSSQSAIHFPNLSDISTRVPTIGNQFEEIITDILEQTKCQVGDVVLKLDDAMVEDGFDDDPSAINPETITERPL